MTSLAGTEVAARAYGVRFRVRVTHDEHLPVVVARLPPGTRVCAATERELFCVTLETQVADTGQRVTRVLLDGEVQVESSSEIVALDALESVVRFEVARRAPRWTFVHAGVVGWNGRAILVPGESRAGKSTLVRALVRAGASYYSDEYAVLDRRGLVYPFAQPLMYRTDIGTRERMSVGDLGGTLGSGALRVGLVVMTRYAAGASWRPDTLTPGEGLLELLTNSVRAQSAPVMVMRALAGVVESAPVIRSLRGEADDTTAALLRRHADWHSSRRSIA